VSDYFHFPTALACVGKKTPVSADKEAGGLQSRSGRFEEKSPIPGIEPRFLGCPARRLVTVDGNGTIILPHLTWEKL
jgi:hypothetical protein